MKEESEIKDNQGEKVIINDFKIIGISARICL